MEDYTLELLAGIAKEEGLITALHRHGDRIVIAMETDPREMSEEHAKIFLQGMIRGSLHRQERTEDYVKRQVKRGLYKPIE